MEIGDYLIVLGVYLGIKYVYYGIYSFNFRVIYFGGDNKEDVIVEEIDLYKFILDNKNLKRIKYKICLLFEEVLEKVRKVLNKKIFWGDYNLVFNNCEYFVIFCKIGVGFLL